MFSQAIMKSKIYILFLCFSFHSCYTQESIIVEDNLIEWKNYPNLFQNYEKLVLKDRLSFLDKVDMHEIIYLSDGLKIQAFAAIPKGMGDKKLPVIIFNRGGNRDFGALSLFREPKKYAIAIYFSQLAQEGYIVMASNYRGAGKSEGKDEFGGSDITDVLNLIKLTEEIPVADTTKIGMYGWSRGAMMTLLALCKTNRIKTAVVGGTPSDLTVIDRPEMEKGVYAELIPNYWQNKAAELKKRSAYYFAEELPKNVPVLLLHGNSDWRVKTDNALKLAQRFDELRIPYRLKIFEGADHSISQFREEVDEDVLNWFNAYLKEGRKIPNMEYHGN